MKRTITIISFLFLSFIMEAQIKYDANVFSDEKLLNKKYVDYYSDKTSVKGSSTTFVVEDYQDFIMVYNSKNKLSKESKPKIKNSKEFVQVFDLPDISVDYKTAKDIITSSINKDKLEMLSHTKGGYLRVQLYVNPISGRVMEVKYTFGLYKDCYEMLSISPEELESIEKLAKEKIVVKVPTIQEYPRVDCASLNYVLSAIFFRTDNCLDIEG